MYEKLYRELLLRYNELKNENKLLLYENACMRQQLGLAEKVDDEEITVSEATTVNKYSSSKEKIELFRSLFKGLSGFRKQPQ